MTDAPVLTALHEGWGELVLNRPERRNALAPASAQALREGLGALLGGGARVVLLRGEGGTFCSGLDIDLFQGDAARGWAADWTGFHRDLYACPAVVICALDRYAINAGAALALGSDLMVAGEGAVLTVLAALYGGVTWSGSGIEEVRAAVFAALVGSLAALVLANRSFSVALGVSLRRPNPALWTVMLVSALLLGLAMVVPALRSVLGFSEPSALILSLAGLTSVALLPLLGRIARRRG